MTNNELSVCQQYHIPVKLNDKYESLYPGEYHINTISQYYDQEFKRYNQAGAISDNDIVLQINIRGVKSFVEKKEQLEQALDKLIAEYTGITYDVTLEQHQRCVFSVDSHYIDVAAGFENLLNSKLKEHNQIRLDLMLKRFLDKGMSRSEINKLIKSRIDFLTGKKSK